VAQVRILSDFTYGAELKSLNFLLSALAAEDREALLPAMEEVSLVTGQVLFEEGARVDTLYFPGSACLSVVTAMKDGKSVETATIGRESATGLLDAMADRPTRSRIFAQVPGSAIKLSAQVFRARAGESEALLRLVFLHIRASAIQAEQGVACNITHEVPGRLARWLLMTQDRVGASSFSLTQEYMAVMTGVQRSTVSVMAGELKKAGVINYSRGHVTIRDRAALERHACECYEIVGEEFRSLRDGHS
jgi:CRP-like cAMP-binding protein